MKHESYNHAMTNSTWTTLPPKEIIDTTIKNLTTNGFNPIFVETLGEAKEKALALIPEDAEVFTMTSVTLSEAGIDSEINESGKYYSIRKELMTMNRDTQGRDMQKLGTAPDIAIGSVQAVTEDGHVLIASRTGSQIPAYAYGSRRVIWIVGAQKIVKNTEEGLKRIYQHALPLEGIRAEKAYGKRGSRVNKILIVNEDERPQRTYLILVNQVVGF